MGGMSWPSWRWIKEIWSCPCDSCVNRRVPNLLSYLWACMTGRESGIRIPLGGKAPPWWVLRQHTPDRPEFALERGIWMPTEHYRDGLEDLLGVSWTMKFESGLWDKSREIEIEVEE